MEIILKMKILSTSDVDDMVRLFICLLVNCFLFTNTHTNLRSRLLRHIDELEDIENLDWVDIVVCCTLDNMKA